MEYKQACISRVYNSIKIDFFNEKRVVFVLQLAQKAEPLLSGVIDKEIITEEEIREIIDLKVQNTGWPREAAEETVRTRIELIQITRKKIESDLKAEKAERKAEASERKAKEANEKKLEAEERADQAEKRILEDPLTEVSSRFAYMQSIKSEIRHFKRTKQPLGLFMVDIDHFKNVNDIYGHTKADYALKKVAKILQTSLRGSDVVARYGGEEFVIIARNTPKANMPQIAEKLRKAVQEGTKEDAKKDMPSVTISLGYITLDSDNMEDFIRPDMEDVDAAESFQTAADTALYASKNNGRNQSTEYKKGLKMPSRLEKITKKLFYAQEELSRLQSRFIKKKRTIENAQKNNDEETVKFENEELKEIEKNVLKLKKDIEKIEKALEEEKIQAAA